MNKPQSHIDAARALDAACEQIELALQESQPSVDSLAEALRKLAGMLGEPAATQRHDALAAMRTEMLRAITCLQYHDRMSQHLSHVRDYLSESAGRLASHDGPNHDGPAAEPWTGLHRSLQAEPGRMYPSRSAASGHAPPGDIDLF